jgi:hypothetical protein
MVRTGGPVTFRIQLVGAALVLMAASCTSSAPEPSAVAEPASVPAVGTLSEPPIAVRSVGPEVSASAMADLLQNQLRSVATPFREQLNLDTVRLVGESGDVRAAWLLVDVLRFIQAGPESVALSESLAELTGLELDPFAPGVWVEVTNQLIIWDVPSPDNHRELKKELYGQHEPFWRELFGDDTADVDWRMVTWGGVAPDQRQLDDIAPCRCIPALDHPATTSADDGEWYPDQRIVFGVVINGAARAYPRHMMEVHELVNDTLGGSEIAIPYCTLCGSAQVFLAGEGDDRLVLRTSGLLQRSNKIMFDLKSSSYFDTFTGKAISGELQGLILEQLPIVTATWGEWKAAHPDTTILAEDGGIGRAYDEDPLNGRDLGGPIFPVGPIDARLKPQEQVLGVFLEGQAFAFPVVEARLSLQAGDQLTIEGITLSLDGDGIVARSGGQQLVTHQAFWFAWSQFHPSTLLWVP